MRLQFNNGKYSYIISIIVIAIVAFVFISGGTQDKITFDGEMLQVKGMYGTKTELNEISSVEFSENLPKIKRKVNGMDLLGGKTGIFTLEEIGKARLYINSLPGPVIVIHNSNEPILINFKDSEETKQFYDKIAAAIEKK